jgi:hypothetical protein
MQKQSKSRLITKLDMDAAFWPPTRPSLARGTSISSDQAPNRLSLTTAEVEHDNKHGKFDYENKATYRSDKDAACWPATSPALARRASTRSDEEVLAADQTYRSLERMQSEAIKQS